MPLLTLVIVILALVPSVLGQGTVHFTTRITAVLDAPVELMSGKGPGPSWTSELVKVEPTGVLVPIPQSITTFRTVPPGGSALLAKYVVPVPTVEVPGTAMVEASPKGSELISPRPEVLMLLIPMNSVVNQSTLWSPD